MEAYPREIVYYVADTGLEPCRRWIEGLLDEKARAKIRVKIAGLGRGNFAKSAPVGEGVHELKIDYGPGFRVYFGNDGDSVVMLWAGDQSTQDADIRRAKEYWRDYHA